MSLEIDHLFVFVEPDFADSAQLAALRAWGLTVEFGRVHAGQGTANKLALFPEQSLEFLWLADRREAEANPLRLDRRADGRAQGANPFGICLRGRLDPQLRAQLFWDYVLVGTALGSIAIARLSDALGWPLIFVFDTEIDTRPKSLGYPPGLLKHPGGYLGIERVELVTTGDLSLALGPLRELLPDNLHILPGERPSMRIELARERVSEAASQSSEVASSSPRTFELGPLTLVAN